MFNAHLSVMSMPAIAAAVRLRDARWVVIGEDSRGDSQGNPK
jgi:hypothetical protein